LIFFFEILKKNQVGAYSIVLYCCEVGQFHAGALAHTKEGGDLVEELQFDVCILFFKIISQGEWNKPNNCLCGWFAYLDTSFIQLSWFGEMFDTETATQLAEGTLHVG
jgi:hypothetical protein